MCFPGWKYLALVSLTVSIFVDQKCQATSSTGKYASRHGAILSAAIVTDSLNASSKIECILGCGRATGCKSVSWSESLQQCRLSDRSTDVWWAATGDDKITEDPAWDTFSAIVYPVAQYSGTGGHYTLTFDQARQMCEDHDTELATAALVLTARSMGMELCGCGWFADGGNGFVLQAEDRSCWYHYSTGILYCGFGLANAWCVMH